MGTNAYSITLMPLAPQYTTFCADRQSWFFSSSLVLHSRDLVLEFQAFGVVVFFLSCYFFSVLISTFTYAARTRFSFVVTRFGFGSFMFAYLISTKRVSIFSLVVFDRTTILICPLCLFLDSALASYLLFLQ